MRGFFRFSSTPVQNPHVKVTSCRWAMLLCIIGWIKQSFIDYADCLRVSHMIMSSDEMTGQFDKHWSTRVFSALQHISLLVLTSLHIPQGDTILFLWSGNLFGEATPPPCYLPREKAAANYASVYIWICMYIHMYTSHLLNFRFCAKQTRYNEGR